MTIGLDQLSTFGPVARLIRLHACARARSGGHSAQSALTDARCPRDKCFRARVSILRERVTWLTARRHNRSTSSRGAGSNPARAMQALQRKANAPSGGGISDPEDEINRKPRRRSIRSLRVQIALIVVLVGGGVLLAALRLDSATREQVSYWYLS